MRGVGSLSAFVPTGSLSWTICLFTLGVFLLAVWQIARGALRARLRIAAIHAVLDGVEPSELVARRGEISDRAAKSADPRVRHAWHEFDETLVAAPYGSRLWNTRTADTFFGTEALAPEVLHNRLLVAAPSALTALGVLGTFAGLTIGLGHVNISSDASVADLMEGVDPLILGAGAAFVTSLWGVFFSLVLSLVHRVVESRVDASVDALQRDIDKLFENHSTEQSLLAIQRATDDSSKALDEMAEKIGNKLQEVVGQNYAQVAVQSSGVFETLVEKFTEEFRTMGITLADRLDAATNGLTGTVDRMAQATARQVELLDEHLPLVVTNLDVAAKRVGLLTEGLEAASEKLRATADIFDNAAGSLGDAVADGIDKLDDVAQRTAGTVATVDQIGEKLQTLSETTLTAAEQIGQAAGQVNGGFTELQDRLKALTASVNDWLNEYEREVSRQVEHRMSEWNTHTRDYSDQMTRVTRALADVMEELEATASRSTTHFDRLHDRLGVYTDTLGTAITRFGPERVPAVADAGNAGEVTGAASDTQGASL